MVMVLLNCSLELKYCQFLKKKFLHLTILSDNAMLKIYDKNLVIIEWNGSIRSMNIF